MASDCSDRSFPTRVVKHGLAPLMSAMAQYIWQARNTSCDHDVSVFEGKCQLDVQSSGTFSSIFRNVATNVSRTHLSCASAGRTQSVSPILSNDAQSRGGHNLKQTVWAHTCA